ncbi:MAG TPA: Ig-like domain-containing protein [Gemmatimonadaceae bacterium]|nr:Ig-like domain-containing protein [Gemmatimonadaceae bacterium]
MLALTVVAGGCERDPLEPFPPVTVLEPVVSNPTARIGPGTAAAGFATLALTSAEEVVYVSLPAGTIPDGGLATIRNSRTGGDVPAAMAAGGFDPVTVEGRPGELLNLEVLMVGGGNRSYLLKVPAARRPIVVRTNPVPRKRDVPLNALIKVVFSEPIDLATLAGIQLWGAGKQVGGQVTLSADGLRAVFRPAQLLAPNADHVLIIPSEVADLSGDRLESSASVEFTTGSALALATAWTEQAAVFVHPLTNAPRAIVFDAILHDDGRVTGNYHLFYPENGHAVYGTVTCFATDGNAAWVAGVVDSASNPNLMVEQGWRAVDNGPPGAGLPDQLSLAHPLVDGGVRSAQEWCATRPVADPWFGDIDMHDLITGDIVVTGESPPPPMPPPPPPPASPGSGLTQIALFSPSGAIQMMGADGSALTRLTEGPDHYNPAWSPDGSRLAFQRHGQGSSNLYVVNWDGSGLTRLTSGPQTDQDPAWSPHGTRIAFLRDGSIHVMDGDGSNVTRVSHDGHDSHPGWSPDGSRIVFASSRSGVNAIHVMNADGSDVIQLTSGSEDYNPSWSPDGSRIVFQRNPYGVGVIHLINPDGSGLTRVAAGQTPSWSPDGRRIIYELFGITHVMLDGSGMTRMRSGFGPVWQPVGSMPPDPAPFRSVELVDGDGQTGRVLTTLPRQLSVRVTADDGVPQAKAAIHWDVWWPEGGAVNPSLSSYFVVHTDSQGISSVSLTLGDIPGPITVRAALVDGTARRGEVIFTATGVP